MWWVIGGLVFAYFVYWNFFTKSEPRIYSSIPTSDLTRFLEVLRDRGFDGGRLVVVPSGKRVDAPLQVVVRVPDKTSQPQFELHVPLAGAWLQDPHECGAGPSRAWLGGETRVSDDVLRIGAGTDPSCNRTACSSTWYSPFAPARTYRSTSTSRTCHSGSAAEGAKVQSPADGETRFLSGAGPLLYPAFRCLTLDERVDEFEHRALVGGRELLDPLESLTNAGPLGGGLVP